MLLETYYLQDIDAESKISKKSSYNFDIIYIYSRFLRIVFSLGTSIYKEPEYIIYIYKRLTPCRFQSQVLNLDPVEFTQ